MLNRIISFIVILFSTISFAQTTVVKGKLLDVTGKPSNDALIGILSPVGTKANDFVSCDKDGNYVIKLTKPGQNNLLYSIPSHSALRIPVRNNSDKNLTIDITLATYKYKNNYDEVGVAGTFNDFDIVSPEKMTKQADGTYIYEVTSDQKEIKYQLCGIEFSNRTINGTESIGFEADSTGDYRSILNVRDGKAVIVFNPLNLLIKDAEYKVVFSGSDYDEKMFNINNEYTKKISSASQKMREHIDAKKNMQDFQFDSGGYFTDLMNKIDAETNEEIRNYYKLIYISFAGYRPKDYNFEKATQFFESIQPGDPAWELLSPAYFSYYQLVPQYKWNELQEKFLKECSSNTIKLSILSNKLANAKFSSNTEELKNIHALIAKDYSDLKEAQDLLKRFPIETKIKVGVEIPDFEVVSLDNQNEKFSKQGMLGKVYMIDFWATWCGPCVGEMESLHNAYEKFKDKGFEIVSLSMDAKADDVVKFRNDKWKMPWRNSFIGDKTGRLIANKFEVIGIPRPILVSAEGKILEMEGNLRGTKLETTLKKYFK